MVAVTELRPRPCVARAPVGVSSSRSHGVVQRRRRRPCSVEFKSGAKQQQQADEEEGGGGGDEQQQQIRKPQCLLVERYQDGTDKRYLLDTRSQLQPIWEEQQQGTMTNNILQNDKFPDLSWLPPVIRKFILPAGFPESVSDDYLEYILLQFPTNVTGWICHALVTSSLLKAVGVGSLTGTSAAASAAAIRWVSKDGLGAIGRLFIGGNFGNLFDDDPKQWRMYADFIGSAGSIFELSTQLYPAYFLPLASLGNFAKAVARGLKDPSFRVIQNHFAVNGNLGEVAAKEEVWEVTAQLVGLGIGILIMDTPGIQTSYAMLAFTWLNLRILHLWLRYQSLSVLRFRTPLFVATPELQGQDVLAKEKGITFDFTRAITWLLPHLHTSTYAVNTATGFCHCAIKSLFGHCFSQINLKRARVLVKSHVLHHTVPGYVDCNKEENILSWERFLHPRVTFGVPMRKMIGRKGSSNMVKALLKLYTKQKYILFVNQKGSGAACFFVTFKVGATSLSVLKSLWHAHWLHEHPQEAADDVLSWLEESLATLEEGFTEFLQQLERAGWEENQIIFKVPQDILFHEVEPPDLAIVDE